MDISQSIYRRGNVLNFRWHHQAGIQIYSPRRHQMVTMALILSDHIDSDRFSHHSSSLWKILEMLKDNFLHLKADLVGRVEGWLKLGQL